MVFGENWGNISRSAIVDAYAAFAAVTFPDIMQSKQTDFKVTIDMVKGKVRLLQQAKLAKGKEKVVIVEPGGLMEDRSINIGGSVVGHNQIGQTLINCNNIIQQQPAGEQKKLLETLQSDVQTLVDNLPTDKKDKEEEIAGYLKMVDGQTATESALLLRFCSGSFGCVQMGEEFCRQHRRNNRAAR